MTLAHEVGRKGLDMTETDTAKERLKTFKEELKEKSATLEKEETEIDKKVHEINKEISEIEKRRKELASGIDAASLRLYERINDKYPGSALASAKDERCLGCHMHIPPQMFNDIKKLKGIASCPACVRILYIEEMVKEKGAV